MSIGVLSPDHSCRFSVINGNNDCLLFVDAFDYFEVELQKYPGQGLGLSIVGRR